MTFVSSVQLISIKVKRNQFPNILAGLPNHQFAYVLFGNISIVLSGLYIFCLRSDDG